MENKKTDIILEEDLMRITNAELPWEKMRNKNILITGATGLLGSFLIKALIKINEVHLLNIKISAMVRNEEKAKSIFGNLIDNKDINLVIADVTNAIETDIKADYIIHTASVTQSKQMVTYPVETIDISINGTKNILEYAKNSKSESVVYISSMEMYGKADPSLELVTEDDYGYVDVLNVRSCYPEGKRMCECMCKAYSHEYNIPVKIARLAQTFGAGVSKSENRVFAQFAKSLINEKDIVLMTDGSSMGNYCYTADVAEGILFMLLLGENGQAYNVSNENTNTSIKDMAQMIADMSEGKTKVIFDIPDDPLKCGFAPKVKMKLSSQKLRNLGWEPKVDLKEMYIRLMESWKYQ